MTSSLVLKKFSTRFSVKVACYGGESTGQPRLESQTRPNKPLERTAHPAGFLRLLWYRRGQAAAHWQR
jgi:hypothetical protein